MYSTALKRHAGVNLFFYFFTLFILTFLLNSCSDQKTSSDQKVTNSQRAYLTPEVSCGTVQFSDGCSPGLDTLIRFGIALIHHMTYEDAEYTFNRVIELDKDCFWGYWGKAMTYVHPLWPDIPDKEILEDGYVLTQNALKLAETKKEKFYGAAIAAYFENGINQKEPERLNAFYYGWKTASKELPDDVEARMFYVLSMLSVASPYDKTFKVQREAGALAESVLKIIPDHPAAFHYAIHAYDAPPLASNALRIARTYYKLAPELPHALHMPTHIFTRLGYWQESIDLNLRSAESAKKIPVEGQISGQYFHALDYLTYAYIQKSQKDKAQHIAELLETLSGTFEPTPVTSYALAAIPGRVALEFRNWSEAANLKLNTHSNFPWDKFPQYEALVYFAKGIGGGRSGNIDAAKQSLQKLEELQNGFEKSEANDYWINQIEIQKTGVKAWLLFAENEMDEAIKTMTLAAELEDATEKNPVTPGSLLPAREMLGDLLLEMNKPQEALLQYELCLKSNPNRFNSLRGAGKSAELTGDMKKAAMFYKSLLKNSESSDSNKDVLVHAKNVTAKKI